mgnify:CR=1 FL=1
MKPPTEPMHPLLSKHSRRRFLAYGSAAALGELLLPPLSYGQGRHRTTVVETSHGKLRGVAADGIKVFRGVHYAQSTSGKNRFRPPQPVIPWAGVRDATRLGHPSPQSNPDFPVWLDPNPGSEDCLVLNIWAPDHVTSASRLPVMFWIHGGGYTFGSAGAPLYDLGTLARLGNVVAVGINHRLQAFGFTDLGSHGEGDFAGSGNAGMLDIIAALRWVRENIATFGGDAGNVTAFGQSGGGAKISTVMAMPAGKGLLDKAIVQSGSVFRYVEPAEAEETAERTFTLLGLRKNDISALQAVPTKALLACGDRIMKEARGTGNPALKYAPVIDGRTLPERPWYSAAPEGSGQVPLLIGTTRDETIIYMPDEARKPLGDDEAIAKAVVDSVPAYTPDLARVRALIPFYRKSMGEVSDPELVLQLSTDLSYWEMAVHQAELQSAAGAPVFSYRCDWRTPCYGGTWAPHTMELPFVLGIRHYGPAWDGKDTDAQRAAADPSNARFHLGDQMLAAWTTFARTGDPSTASLTWPRYTVPSRETMIFDGTSRVLADPRGDYRRALIATP